MKNDRPSPLHLEGISGSLRVLLRKPLPLFLVLFYFLTKGGYSQATEPFQAPFNTMVLQEVASMPTEGGYSAGNLATHALQRAVLTTRDHLEVDPRLAMPSYCSGATYLVFLKVISALLSANRMELSPAMIAELRPSGQPDGAGVWGRWNANGPGTARLCRELALGSNFTDLAEAQPGDFLKIFWNEAIGASEHGHSVIYLGTERRNGIQTVSFWSSNVPGGFGRKTVPLSRVRRMIFSRLTHPYNLANLPLLPRSDNYLASLQLRNGTVHEMEFQCGLER